MKIGRNALCRCFRKGQRSAVPLGRFWASSGSLPPDPNGKFRSNRHLLRLVSRRGRNRSKPPRRYSNHGGLRRRLVFADDSPDRLSSSARRW